MRLSVCYPALKETCPHISVLSFHNSSNSKEKGPETQKENIFFLWAYIPSPLLLFLSLLDSLDQESLDLSVLKAISTSFKHIKSFITSPFEKCVEFLLHVYF